MNEMKFMLEPIRRRIRAAFPDSEISVVDNVRDDVGGVIYVRNAPLEKIERMGIAVDYVVVPLDDKPAPDVLIVPIPGAESPAVSGAGAATEE